MPTPSLFDFLRDAESWRGNAANRGMVAGTLGAPLNIGGRLAWKTQDIRNLL